MTYVCWSGRERLSFIRIDYLTLVSVQKITKNNHWHYCYLPTQRLLRLSTGSEHLQKPKLTCAFEHYLSQEWFVYDCLYRIALTSHEVNCYSNWPTLHRMMTTTFNSQHVFHNYPQHELVVSAHSENITFGHNWVLPADRHGPTTRCYHTDAPRHPFNRISRSMAAILHRHRQQLFYPWSAWK